MNNPGPGSQNATPPSSSHAGTPSVSSQSTATATVKRVFNLADDIDALQFPCEVVESVEEFADEDWGSWELWWCYHVSAVECEHCDISSDVDILDAETGELVENFDLSVSDAFPGDEGVGQGPCADGSTRPRTWRGLETGRFARGDCVGFWSRRFSDA